MEQVKEGAARRESGSRVQKRSKKPLLVIGIFLAALLAAYGALCAYAVSRPEIWKGTVVLGQDLGGLTVEEAAARLESTLPTAHISIYLYPDGEYPPEERPEAPDATVAAADLDIQVDLNQAARDAYEYPLYGANWWEAGWRYLTHRGVFYGISALITVDESRAADLAEALAESLTREPVDAAYQVTEDGISIQTARDGRAVSSLTLMQALSAPYWDGDLTLNIPYVLRPAQTLTAQEIHDDCAGEAKNATYDTATDSIVPEQISAEFDVEEAQAAMDTAQPGETVTIPAQTQLPAVTAEDLEALLFRDLLGECTTRVGGTAARRSNVKLSAAAINEYVMNAGDVFSYNGVVGQRTAARGYQAAPAYVQGETVDEIGGGICQTSSTLYLACLRSNLEITERYAHRYIPSYIPAGMDATVSWGGPDYKFTNNTDYPIKIVTSYADNYLTVQVWGTNLTGVTAKVTNEYLSTTPYETIYEDDPTLAPGEEQVKTSPYTGYKYRTYRNLYDADGKLISSAYEATSDYKARNRVILRGPAVEETLEPEELPDQPTDPTGESGANPDGTNSDGANPDSANSDGTDSQAPETGGEPSSGAEGAPSAPQNGETSRTVSEEETPPLVVDLTPPA